MSGVRIPSGPLGGFIPPPWVLVFRQVILLKRQFLWIPKSLSFRKKGCCLDPLGPAGGLYSPSLGSSFPPGYIAQTSVSLDSQEPFFSKERLLFGSPRARYYLLCCWVGCFPPALLYRASEASNRKGRFRQLFPTNPFLLKAVGKAFTEKAFPPALLYRASEASNRKGRFRQRCRLCIPPSSLGAHP